MSVDTSRGGTGGQATYAARERLDASEVFVCFRDHEATNDLDLFSSDQRFRSI